MLAGISNLLTGFLPWDRNPYPTESIVLVFKTDAIILCSPLIDFLIIPYYIDVIIFQLSINYLFISIYLSTYLPS